MLEHPRLKLTPGLNISTFYLDTKHIDDDVSFINNNKIDSIAVNPYKGYTTKTIDVLLSLKRIKRLSVEATGIDLSALTKLAHLESLFMREDNFNVDLSNCKELKSLNFHYDKSIIGLQNLNCIEEIIVSEGDSTFFNESIFSNYQGLNRLEIIKPKFPEEMSFFKKLARLKELEILYSKGEIDLDFLRYIKTSLENLKIKNSKKVIHIETIKEATNLKCFSLVDSVPLDSSNFFSGLRNLEVLIILGTSFFKDGDLSSLKRMNLKHVSIDDKKHYNLKYADMPKLTRF
jgi:hypothetical protein